jgi:hypothetical protein
VHDAHGLGIEVVAVRAAGLVAIGVGHAEQPVVQPYLRGDRVGRRHPVDRALDLAVRAREPRPRFRVERAAHRDDRVAVLLDAGAADDADTAQPHLAAGHEAVEALRRDLHEILALDPQLARERDVALAHRRILRMVRERDRLAVVRRQVLDDELQRVDHGHPAR